MQMCHLAAEVAVVTAVPIALPALVAAVVPRVLVGRPVIVVAIVLVVTNDDCGVRP